MLTVKERIQVMLVTNYFNCQAIAGTLLDLWMYGIDFMWQPHRSISNKESTQFEKCASSKHKKSRYCFFSGLKQCKSSNTLIHLIFIPHRDTSNDEFKFELTDNTNRWWARTIICNTELLFLVIPSLFLFMELTLFLLQVVLCLD
jgi:hypothetical protein